MRAMLSSDPGVPWKRYTVVGSESELFGEFDTQEEVLEVLRNVPDIDCTIKFGLDVEWNGPERDELARKIEEL
ncbi:MAG: hypothetical protein AB7S74_15600 [Hyphomicrobium sp.]